MSRTTPDRSANRLIAAANRWATFITGVSLILLALSLLWIAHQFPIGAAVKRLQGRIENLGMWGPLLFGLFYAAAVVALVPGSTLTLAAGALFGLIGGTVTASVSSTVGAALAFLISRCLARKRIAAKLQRHPGFEAVDRAIQANGWKIIALLRLSPAVPFNVQNYLYGLTGIRFGTYVLTSWLAMLPGTFLYVYLGHLGRVGLEAVAGETEHPRAIDWWMLILGLAASIAATVYLTRLARRALRQQLTTPPVEDSRPDSWPWKATLAALLAAAALAAAVYGQYHPELFSRFFPVVRPRISRRLQTEFGIRKRGGEPCGGSHPFLSAFASPGR